MRLTKKAIEGIRDSSEIKRELIYQMKKSDSTFYRILRLNEADNEFTKVRAVKIISEGLNLPESEILED